MDGIEKKFFFFAVKNCQQRGVLAVCVVIATFRARLGARAVRTVFIFVF